MSKRYRTNEFVSWNQNSQKRLKKESSINTQDVTIVLYNRMKKLEDIIQSHDKCIKELQYKLSVVTEEKRESDRRIINMSDYLGLPYNFMSHQSSYIS